MGLVFLGLFAPFAVPRLPSFQASYSNAFAPWWERLTTAWTGWDGGWYGFIAADGYSHEGTIAFFPLYPYLIRFVGYVISLGNLTPVAGRVAGLLISLPASLVLFVLLYRLVCHEYNGEVAGRTVLYLTAFPTSFFLAAVYTENLFLALTVGTFYFARREQWALALGLTALAVLTRNQGVLVALALTVEYGRQIGWNPRKLDRRLLYFGLPALALSGWLLFNYLSFGNPFAFQNAVAAIWGREFAWPWTTILTGLALAVYHAPDAPDWQPFAQNNLTFAPFDLLATFFFQGLFWVAIRRVRRNQMPLCFGVFFGLALLQPLFTMVPASPLYSMPRYFLVIFPAFILLAGWANAGRSSTILTSCCSPSAGSAGGPLYPRLLGRLKY